MLLKVPGNVYKIVHQETATRKPFFVAHMRDDMTSRLGPAYLFKTFETGLTFDEAKQRAEELNNRRATNESYM